MPSKAQIDRAIARVRTELEGSPRIRAAGIFGSALRGDIWEHSDVDLFVICDAEGELWDGCTLRREGVRVQLQILSASSWDKVLEKNTGSPLFQALQGVEPWFDLDGRLGRAIALAHDCGDAAHVHRACRELGAGVDALHNAEKLVARGHRDDARVALMQALPALAGARLAINGTLPLRAVWSTAGATDVPEYADFQAALAGAEPSEIVTRAWERVRADLPAQAALLVDFICERGPVVAADLEGAPLFKHIEVSERLLDELLALGLIEEGSAQHAALEVQQLSYTRPRNAG